MKIPTAIIAAMLTLALSAHAALSGCSASPKNDAETRSEETATSKEPEVTPSEDEEASTTPTGNDDASSEEAIEQAFTVVSQSFSWLRSNNVRITATLRNDTGETIPTSSKYILFKINGAETYVHSEGDTMYYNSPIPSSASEVQPGGEFTFSYDYYEGYNGEHPLVDFEVRAIGEMTDFDYFHATAEWRDVYLVGSAYTLGDTGRMIAEARRENG